MPVLSLIKLPAEVLRRFDNYHFQGGPDTGFHYVSPGRGAVAFADYDMCMYLRLAIFF